MLWLQNASGTQSTQFHKMRSRLQNIWASEMSRPFSPLMRPFEYGRTASASKRFCRCSPPIFFVRINHWERVKVLESPGVLHIVGNGRNYIPVADTEVEFLRSGLFGRKVEPYTDLIVGKKVRITAGLMQGVEGILVRKCNSMRFVLTLNLINQHAAVEVDADALQSVPA